MRKEDDTGVQAIPLVVLPRGVPALDEDKEVDDV